MNGMGILSVSKSLNTIFLTILTEITLVSRLVNEIFLNETPRSAPSLKLWFKRQAVEVSQRNLFFSIRIKMQGT